MGQARLRYQRPTTRVQPNVRGDSGGGWLLFLDNLGVNLAARRRSVALPCFLHLLRQDFVDERLVRQTFSLGSPAKPAQNVRVQANRD